MESYRYFTAEQRPNAGVIRITESYLCGDAIAEILKIELASFILPGQTVVIDFADVNSISSSVIGALVSVRAKLANVGGQLKLSSVSLPIREIYRTLNLEGTVFHVYPSIDAALTTPVADRESNSVEFED